MAKILLVDDDDLVRYALGKLLRKAGHEVVEANDGKQALAIMQANRPNLLITDVIMPEQDGLGILREVRGFKGDMPVIVMSGGGRLVGTDFLALAKSMGASGILAKPFEDEALLALVEKLIPPTKR